MPPTSIPVWQESVEVRVELTQQDIEILYEIVTYAAEIPETTPWNALFKAYDGVLRAREIDPGQDDVCFRFLMRMAEMQRGTWFEKYVALLQRWGYPIPEFEDAWGEETISVRQANRLISPPRRPPRIASSSSVPPQDEKTENRRVSNGRHHGAVRSALVSVTNGSPRVGSAARARAISSRDPHYEEEQRRRQREATKAEFAFPINAFQTVNTNSSVGFTSQEEDVVSSSTLPESSPLAYAPPSSPPPRIQHRIPRSSSPNRPLPQRPPQHHFTTPLREYTSVHDFISSDHDDADDATQDQETAYTEALPPIRSQREYIQAATRAAEFYNIRLRNLIYRMFSGWRQRTVRVQRYHEVQEEVAKRQDRHVLLLQTLELWREGAYWKGVERRASRRRELEVMRKAFDIWKSKTKAIADRRERVNNGLLMHRCFSAWRKHAVETNRKVKSVQLRAFLHLWQRKLEERRVAQAQADLLYQSNLKYRAYWTWYFHYFGSTVPLYHKDRLKKQALWKLREELAVRQSQIADAEYHYNSVLARRCLVALKSTYNKHKEQAEEAERCRERTLITNTLGYWNKAAKLQPAADAIRDLVNDRLTYDCFKQWRDRTQQEVAARQVYEIRLLRSTFRQWDMELRGRVLRAKIDQRILTDVLYNWILRWRGNLFVRVQNRRLQSEGLNAMVGKLRSLSSTYGPLETRVLDMRQQNALATALLAWRSARQQVVPAEVQATEVYRRALLRRTLQTMSAKMEMIRQMNEDAKAAAFYAATKPAMKHWTEKWKETSKKRMKQQRKVAYILVIQKRNTNIARQCLQAMRDKLDHVRDLNTTAGHYSSFGSDDAVRKYFSSWRSQAEAVVSNSEIAESVFRERILSSKLSDWRWQNSIIERKKTIQETYSNFRKADQMKELLERWRYASWNKTSALNGLGDRFVERLETRRKKKYLRGWLRLLRERQHQRQQQIFGSNRRNFSPDDGNDDTHGEVLDRLSHLEINEWIPPPFSPAAVPGTFDGSRSMGRFPTAAGIEAPMFPSTPGGRAARTRAIMLRSVPPRPRLNLAVHSQLNGIRSTTPIGTPLKRGSFDRSVSPSLNAAQNGSRGSSRNAGGAVTANGRNLNSPLTNSSRRQRGKHDAASFTTSTSRIPIFQPSTSTATTLEVDLDDVSVNGKLSSTQADVDGVEGL